MASLLGRQYGRSAVFSQGDNSPPGEGGIAQYDRELRRRAWAAAASVLDPEIPVLTIADLGILRDVKVAGGEVEVIITPTYSGCPAMDAIARDLEAALKVAGVAVPQITTVLSPAWSSDWITEEGRAKLRAYGIAPPVAGGACTPFAEQHVACPRCNSQNTERLSEFGSTACKALWRCRACAEPFDYFKCI
jgi:ring-1,2-phenylacetyl-CoA epoxidase subunit PaaD